MAASKSPPLVKSEPPTFTPNEGPTMKRIIPTDDEIRAMFPLHPKWDYTFCKSFDHLLLHHELNELGRHGWECFSIDMRAGMAWLKRQVA